jgi:hypothetical protein
VQTWKSRFGYWYMLEGAKVVVVVAVAAAAVSLHSIQDRM